MEERKTFECLTCPKCGKPFLRTDLAIPVPGGRVMIRGGSCCEECEEKLRSAMLGGSGEFRYWWDL